MWPFTSTPTADPTEPAPPSACPVDHTTRQAWQAQQGANGAAHPPAPSPPQQGNRLSTDREVSSIPRWLPASGASTAAVAEGEPTACPARSAPAAPSSDAPAAPAAAEAPKDEHWVYPSPSSFYSALQRKNREPQAKDMPIVVPIHNAVNERVWEQVMQWEKEAAEAEGRAEGPGSKLVSFVGKPKELSPRARWKTLIGYTAPFDRHDWIVDRPLPPSSPSSPSTPSSDSPTSLRIRYVIDFYTGRGAALMNSPLEAPMPNLAFYIDVRPALDGWEGVKMRTSRWWREVGAGFGVSKSAPQGQGQGTAPSSS